MDVILYQWKLKNKHILSSAVNKNDSRMAYYLESMSPFLYDTEYVGLLYLMLFRHFSPVNGSILKWTPRQNHSLWSSCDISSRPGDNKFLNYLRLMGKDKRRKLGR